jgi:hypothetical protein
MTCWVVTAICSSPAWGSLLWVIWQGQVRPRLIPARKIKTKATELINCHGYNALEMAATEEDRAWRYSNSFEQGYWWRVSKAIEVKSDVKAKTNFARHQGQQ